MRRLFVAAMVSLMPAIAGVPMAQTTADDQQVYERFRAWTDPAAS